MSNVCSLAVILVFLVVTWWLVLVTWWSLLATACYLVVTGGYWSLLLVTAHSHFKYQWSVHSSVILSFQVFSWNWIIRFFWILAWCYKPYQVVHDRARFFGKTFFCPRNGEMGAQTGMNLFCKWKFILFAVFLHKS